jgi:imidazolonepropionase-like amidohydrolase
MAMNGLFSVAALGIGLTLLAAAGQPQSDKVLRFGHLWNGKGLINDATVIVSDNKVVAVSAGRTDIPRGAEEIDLRGWVRTRCAQASARIRASSDGS